MASGSRASWAIDLKSYDPDHMRSTHLLFILGSFLREHPMKQPSIWIATLAAAALLTPLAHGQHHGQHSSNGSTDARQAVQFPQTMKDATLTNMRDHLLALAQIQDKLALGDFDAAAHIAETRLGMSSLRSHGSHDVAKFMPKGMQELGTSMHRSASQFAAVAQTSSVTGDLKATLAALSKVTQTCVACHATYKLQ
jgi:Cytochrome C'